MATPTKKMSQTRSRRRHSARQRDKLKKIRNKLQFVQCPESVWGVRLRHRISPDTGMYHGEHIKQVKQKGGSSDVLEA